MLIRCERCSTVYELDETVLAPEGAPVQCTRCDNVFVAYPPRAAGRTLVGMPAVQAPPVTSAPAPQPAPPAPGAAAPRPQAGPRAPAADRSRAPAQIYRPTPGPSTPVRTAPVLRKDQMGAFEARLRWSARWKWLAPTLLAGVLAVSVTAWFFFATRRDAEAIRARAEGLALLALDDSGSLEAAIPRLDEAARREPGRVEAAADAALARVIRAELLREEWEDSRPREAARDAAGEDDPHVVRSRALVAAARTALGAVPPDQALAPPVVRAQAMIHAYARERAPVAALASAARGREEGDPWLDLAEATVDLDGPAEARDRAVVRLVGICAAHPELLRARWLLARGQASLGRTTEALAALEALVSANTRHEGARRLRARLTAPPPAPPAEAAAQDGTAAAQPEPPRRRPRTEAIPTVVPELSPSPSADLRPMNEEVTSEPLRPAPPPAPTPGSADEDAKRPAPGDPVP